MLVCFVVVDCTCGWSSMRPLLVAFTSAFSDMAPNKHKNSFSSLWHGLWLTLEAEPKCILVIPFAGSHFYHLWYTQRSTKWQLTRFHSSNFLEQTSVSLAAEKNMLPPSCANWGSKRVFLARERVWESVAWLTGWRELCRDSRDPCWHRAFQHATAATTSCIQNKDYKESARIPACRKLIAL